MIEYDDLDFSKMNTNELLETIHNISTEMNSILLHKIEQANEDYLLLGFVRFETIRQTIYLLSISGIPIWQFLFAVIDGYHYRVEKIHRLLTIATTYERVPFELRDRVKEIFEKYDRKKLFRESKVILRYLLLPPYITLYRGGRVDEASLNDGKYLWHWTPRKEIAHEFAFLTKNHVGEGVVYRVRIKKKRIVTLPNNAIFEVIVFDISEKDKVKVIEEVRTPYHHNPKGETKIDFCFLLIEIYLRLWIEYLFTQPVKALCSRFKRLFKN